MTETTEAAALLLTVAWWLPFTVLLCAACLEAYAGFTGAKGANGLALVTSVGVPLMVAVPMGVLGWLAGDAGYGWSVAWQVLKSTALAWGGLFLCLWLIVTAGRLLGSNA